MNKLFLVSILLITITASAQKSNEIGLTGGVSYYLGDINHARQFYAPRPAVGILFRANRTQNYALKASLMQIMVAGNDADFSNKYQKTRNHSFTNRMYELSTVFEYNFLPYSPEQRFRFAPYATIGLAVLAEQNTGKLIVPTIPLGFGIKYAPGKKFSFGAEWVFRKTFTDNIDALNFDNPTSDAHFGTKQLSDNNGNDWYSVLNIVIGYRITSDKKRCAAYPGITRRYK